MIGGDLVPNVDWKRVQEVFSEAINLSGTERAVFLKSQCGDDADLLAEVNSLLDSDKRIPTAFMIPAKGMPEFSRTLKPGTQEQAHQLIGQKIGRFHIEDLIATGGMGTVYLARQSSPERKVALKVMHSGLLSRSAARRFEYESQTLASLAHPNIAQVYEAGVHTFGKSTDRSGFTLPYFAMEYIPDARSITSFAAERSLTIAEKLQLFGQVCDAVHHGHQRGFIHRDLKPSNILVDKEGRVKIIDFGVARSTNTDIAATTLRTNVGELVGTLQYMSPEQCDGETTKLDIRSDVYTLGIVLYELLTEKLPYDVGSTVYQATQAIKERAIPRLSSVNPKLSRDLDTVVGKALEKNKVHRYQSAVELAEDLRRVVKKEPITARPQSATYVLGKYIRRHPWQSMTALVSLALVAALVIFYSKQMGVAQQQKLTEISKYGAAMGQADAALQLNEAASAKRILDETDVALRGWEFEHLMSRVDQSIITIGEAESDNKDIDDIALSPDERHVVVCRPFCNSQCIYDTNDGSLVQKLDVKGEARAAAFGDKGKQLAIMSYVREKDCFCISLWARSDANTYELAKEWFDNTKSAASLVFHPEQPILVCGTNKGLIFWDTSRAEPADTAYRTSVDDISLEGWGCTILFNATGDIIAVGKEECSVVLLWDYNQLLTGKSEQPLAILDAHTYHTYDFSFSPDGKLFATASMDKTICIWSLKSILKSRHNEKVFRSIKPNEIFHGHLRGVRAVAFSADGKQLMSGGGDRAIYVWEIEPTTRSVERPGRYQKTLRGHGEAILKIIALKDGRILSASEDGTLKVWNPNADDVAVLAGHKSSVCKVEFDSTGQCLISIGGQRRIFIWKIRQGKWILDTASALTLGGAIGAKWWQNGDLSTLAVASDNGTVSIWQNESTKPFKRTWVYDTTGIGIYAMKALAVDNRKKRMAVGYNDGSIRVWNIAKLDNPQLEYTVAGHTTPVNALVFLDDEGKWLASGSGGELGSGGDQTIRIWNYTANEPRTVYSKKLAGTVLALVRNPDRTRLAAGCMDGTIQVFDIKETEKSCRLEFIQTLRGHTGAVTSLTYHPTEPRLVSGSQDRMIKVWDTNTGVEVATLTGHMGTVWNLAFDPAGKRLASASQGWLGTDNVAYVWDTTSAADQYELVSESTNLNKAQYDQDSLLTTAQNDREN